MHRSATKCNETIGKWYKNKHGASKIIDTFETYHTPSRLPWLAVDIGRIDMVGLKLVEQTLLDIGRTDIARH
jgi:hypothetical protein